MFSWLTRYISSPTILRSQIRPFYASKSVRQLATNESGVSNVIDDQDNFKVGKQSDVNMYYHKKFETNNVCIQKSNFICFTLGILPAEVTFVTLHFANKIVVSQLLIVLSLKQICRSNHIQLNPEMANISIFIAPQ